MWHTLALLILLSIVAPAHLVKYEPTWDSIDSRPLPDWYDQGKFGIFCHWGVYSVPAFREWFWWYWKGDKPDADVVKYMTDNYRPGTTYADFAKDFRAELFNASEFANIVESAGAKYFVLTSKHHEGFTMWPSRTSWNWNAVDIGPKKDIVGKLKQAFSKTSVKYGLYFSQFEWFNPLFNDDAKYNKTDYVDQVSYPQMLEIVNKYQPAVVWSDGDWGKSEAYWKSREFLAWLYNDSPVKDTVVVNDRWGGDSMGKHGGFLTYSDHYDPGKLLSRKWENCMTLDRNSWGNRRTMTSQDVLTVYEIIEQLARTISCNGNLLLNVGPDMHGKIPPIFEDRLRELGKFIKANSEAIYNTSPWQKFQKDSNNIWYTLRRSTTRVIIQEHTSKGVIKTKQKVPVYYLYAWILNVDGKDIELKNVILDNRKVRITFLGTDVTYESTVQGSLRVPFSQVPLLKLPRTDVFVIKIESILQEF